MFVATEDAVKATAFTLNKSPIAIQRSSLGPPIVTYDVGRRQWILEATYTYQDGSNAITVSAPFYFDLASVPRWLWWLIAPFELSITAPLIHDFFYRFGGNPAPPAIQPPRAYSRRDVDHLFLEIMTKEGVLGWRRISAYVAVRIFGGFAWRG
jgi:hypothetical protein